MIACLRFPYFPTSIEQRDRTDLRRLPLVLGGHSWQRERVWSFSADAAHSGVRLGLSLRQARMVCPDAAFQPPQPTHYNGVAGELFARFLDWSDRVEPRLTQPAIVFYADLDIDKAAPRMAAEMGSIAREQVQLTPSIGLAETKFAAYLAAREANIGRMRDAVADTIPQTRIQTLTLDAKLKGHLLLLGIETLGQLAQLPRAEVGEQFGKKGTRLHQLACGEDPRSVRQPEQARQIAWHWQYEDAVRDGAVVRRSLRRAAHEMATELRQTHSSTRRLSLTLVLEDDSRQAQQVALSHPVHDQRRIEHHLLTLLNKQPPAWGVVEIDVSLEAVAPLMPRQLSLFERAAVSAENHHQTIAELATRYGAHTFAQPKPLALQNHLLERRWSVEEKREALHATAATATPSTHVFS